MSYSPTTDMAICVQSAELSPSQCTAYFPDPEKEDLDSTSCRLPGNMSSSPLNATDQISSSSSSSSGSRTDLSAHF